MKTAKTSKYIIVVFALVISSSSAWAKSVLLRGISPQGGRISVPVPRKEALALRETVRALRRAGCRTYLNIWEKTNPKTRSFPAGKGYYLVTEVKNRAAWNREFGKRTIGFISNGTPSNSGPSGLVRVGDGVFPYHLIRAELRWYGGAYQPRNISAWRDSHVESTFEATQAEVAAFKAFYLA
ncbi:MAG: hypothetical protein V1754_00670, partial [Pseudomonadota bacterium]